MRNANQRQKTALIATLGTEPQVVTAVLDLLIQQGENITKVVVIHTTSQNTTLKKAIEILDLVFSESTYQGKVSLHLIAIEDEDGHPVKDVTTRQESQAAFRCLYNTLRENKNEGHKVHLSIAGGRKTMAVYGMVTAQLLFDEHDCLWHLYSGGDFLESKRLHPQPNDDVHLIQIPVAQWSNVAPILLDFAEIDDPANALARQQEMKLKERLEEIRSFVLGALTPAEERVVSLLVREGLSDNALAEQLYLSSRTIEEHLRSAYRKAVAHWGLANVDRTQLVALLNLYYSTQITGNPA